MLKKIIKNFGFFQRMEIQIAQLHLGLLTQAQQRLSQELKKKLLAR